MTRVVTETTGKADSKSLYMSYVYLGNTPYIHKYEIADTGIGAFEDTSGNRLGISVRYVTRDFDTSGLSEEQRRVFSDRMPKRGDLLVGYGNNSKEPDYVRILTRLDESYFN